jgi:hypothetical protein
MGGCPVQSRPFYSRHPLTFAQRSGDSRDGITPANIDWRIMRPVMHNPPLCTLRELDDGTYTIDDLANFHEAMDIEEELTHRHAEREEARMRSIRR